MPDILLIEDDEAVRKLVETVLLDLGHAVRSAADGEQGVRMFRERPAPYVVTDMLMPHKEGLQTIEELLALDPEVRILAMSGGGHFVGAGTCLDLARGLGAAEVLMKPFALGELRSALERLCSNASSANAS